MKQYKWEQEQIKSMKEYVARFGHGTAKNAKQAQSKEKVLEKMIRAGLTDKPDEEKPLNFRFADPGKLVPPVLAFHDVQFGYPGCQALYSGVNLGVDLDSRIALVGPVRAVRVCPFGFIVVVIRFDLTIHKSPSTSSLALSFACRFRMELVKRKCPSLPEPLLHPSIDSR